MTETIFIFYLYKHFCENLKIVVTLILFCNKLFTVEKIIVFVEIWKRNNFKTLYAYVNPHAYKKDPSPKVVCLHTNSIICVVAINNVQD